MAGFKVSLRTSSIGKKLIHFTSVDSTNKYLFHDYEGPFTEGVVVVADHQTSGRGRMERSWFSCPGKSLLYSILLIPNADSNRIPQLTQICALSVTKVLEDICKLSPKIKWPNDIFVGDRKIGGILSEAIFDDERFPERARSLGLPLVVVGVGLNINESGEDMPDEIRDMATSIYIETGQEQDRESLFSSLLSEFELQYERWKKVPFTEFIEEIGMRFYLTNKEVELDIGGDALLKGKVCGINHQGFLLIRDSDGVITPILSGDIKVCS